MSDEHDADTNSSESGSESGADEGDTEYLADTSGNVDIIDPDKEPGGGGPGGGGPEQPFGGIFGGPSPGRQKFELTPPSFWSRPLRISVIIGGIIYVGSVLPDVLMGQMSWWLLLGLIGIPFILGAAVAYRAWKIPDQGLEIVFEDGSVRMPKGADNATYVDVDLRALRSLVVMARGESELLMVETEGNQFLFRTSDFREPNGPRMLKEELIRRVQGHPEAESILGRMEELEQRARLSGQNPTPVMYALLGMIIVGYVIEYMTGALSSQFGLIQLGANVTPLIADGQWWRLISANFLHGGFIHILMNGFALFVLGMWIERLIGSWRFLWIFLVSAVGGSLGSYLWTGAPLSVGSSTALYGLFAAFGVLHLRYWREMPPPYRQTLRWWAILVGLNFAISMAPMVDAAAHFAGMGVGAVATYVSLLDMKHLDPRQDASVWLKVPTAALVAVFAVGLAMAWNYAQVEHPGDETTVYRYMVDQGVETRSPMDLNRTAWLIATNADASSEQLELARRAVKEAIAINRETNGDNYHFWPYGEKRTLLKYRDTLAMIEFRLGMKAREDETRRKQFTEAIGIEREVLGAVQKGVSSDDVFVTFAESDKPAYRSRLGGFLEAYIQEFDRYEVGPSVPEGTKLQLESRREGLALRLELPTRVEQTTEMIGLVYNESERIGAFHVCLSPDTKGQILERFGPDEWSSGIGPDSRVRLALTATEDPMCPELDEAGDLTVDYWPASSGPANLP